VTGDDFIKFLYQDSFEMGDELKTLFDHLAVLEGVEVNKKPLDKALADLDLGLEKTVLDVEGLSLTFSDVEAYRAAHVKLFEPDVLAKLSEVGFVPAAANDTAQTMEVPNFKIFFIPIGEGPEPDAKQMTDKEALKDVEKVGGKFQGDDNFADKADESVEATVAKMLGEDDEGNETRSEEALAKESETANAVIEILGKNGIKASYEYPGWIDVPKEWSPDTDEGFAVGTVNMDWGMDHYVDSRARNVDDVPQPLPLTSSAEEIADWILSAFKKVFGKSDNDPAKPTKPAKK
jgi:hypothetical protein